MFLRTNAPIIPSIVLTGTAEEQEMAEIYYLELHAIVHGRAKAEKLVANVAPLVKFMVYRDACARSPRC